MGAYSDAPAKAADLGGDCCSDLEERVAELEATTVRKGNKKVSVTLYGQVNKAMLWWDSSTTTTSRRASASKQMPPVPRRASRPFGGAAFFSSWGASRVDVAPQPQDPSGLQESLSLAEC